MRVVYCRKTKEHAKALRSAGGGDLARHRSYTCERMTSVVQDVRPLARGPRARDGRVRGRDIGDVDADQRRDYSITLPCPRVFAPVAKEGAGKDIKERSQDISATKICRRDCSRRRGEACALHRFQEHSVEERIFGEVDRPGDPSARICEPWVLRTSHSKW